MYICLYRFFQNACSNFVAAISLFQNIHSKPTCESIIHKFCMEAKNLFLRWLHSLGSATSFGNFSQWEIIVFSQSSQPDSCEGTFQFPWGELPHCLFQINKVSATRLQKSQIFSDWSELVQALFSLDIQFYLTKDRKEDCSQDIQVQCVILLG